MTDSPISVMVDLETWGLTPGSDLRSIGACVFDPVAGWVGDVDDVVPCAVPATFYRATDNPQGYWGSGTASGRFFTKDKGKRKYPLTRDPQTAQWWADQPADAQAAFDNPTDIHRALREFRAWLSAILEDPAPEKSERLRLWCNGPHFDEAILAAAYRATGQSAPWSHRAPRDFRTIVEAAGGVHIPFEGTEHHALHDAQHQARCVVEAYRRICVRSVF